MKVCRVKFVAFTALLVFVLTDSSAQETYYTPKIDKKIILKMSDSNPGLYSYSIEGSEKDNTAFLGVHIDKNYEGVIVIKVIDESPAFFSGLKTGDILVSIDNQKLNTLSGLITILNNYSPKDMIELEYMRDYKVYRTVVTLAGNEVYAEGPNSRGFNL